MAVNTDDPLTLQRFLLSAVEGPEAASLTILMSSISLACKVIATNVRKAGIAGLYGLHGSNNSSGDDVKKLDIISNDCFINALKFSKQLAVMVSEENDDPIILDDKFAGRYTIAFDPLDGSSNIDCNVSTGTIFAIYDKGSDGPGTKDDILLPGTHLAAAGYCMYGSSTQLVVTFGQGVFGFTLDPSLGEFILTHPNIRIPEKGKTIYSINEGNARYWDEPTRKFVEYCKGQEKPYSARYVGSMVADVHRTLLYGGIFAYPADSKSKSGKLRILYEGNPMSFIMEQAGGKSITGNCRVLDVVPKSIHERVPIFCGSARDVDVVASLYASAGTKL